MTGADRFRRVLGVIFLVIAASMTLLGLTWLAPYLGGIKYLLYWMIPILAAFGAVACALIDLEITRRRYREERAAAAREVFGRPEDTQ